MTNTKEISKPKKEWFDEWFDTDYYHLLYRHRDDEEAAEFINNLIAKYRIPKGAQALDLACGKGRHSIYLNKKGLDVTGVDLSANNISLASQYTNQSLRFEIHDMRQVYQSDSFDYIFNLFTSFGYFSTKAENLEVINSTVASLRSGGLFVLDFLNPYVVVNRLVKQEEKEIEGIRFLITREHTPDDYIQKNIQVIDGNQVHHFHERVKALRRTDFLNFLDINGLELVDLFGDYHLTPYESGVSDRLIFVIRKP